MSTVTVYSSSGLTSQLGLAFLGIQRLGIAVVVRPISELTSPAYQQVLQQLEGTCIALATIGDQLTAHEAGTERLSAGEENGLRAQRDALLSRKRALQASLQALKGGQAQ